MPVPAKVPPLTFQASLCPNTFETVQNPLTTLKTPKPSYCLVGPMLLRSKLPLPLPPSWNVSWPVAVTRPVMMLVGAIVSL